MKKSGAVKSPPKDRESGSIKSPRAAGAQGRDQSVGSASAGESTMASVDRHRPPTADALPCVFWGCPKSYPDLKKFKSHYQRKHQNPKDKASGSHQPELDALLANPKKTNFELIFTTLDVQAIANAFKANSSLTDITLIGLGINDAQASELAEALMHNNKLRTISLKHNDIRQTGAEDISKLFRVCGPDLVVDLLFNPLTPDGAEATHRGRNAVLKAQEEQSSAARAAFEARAASEAAEAMRKAAEDVKKAKIVETREKLLQQQNELRTRADGLKHQRKGTEAIDLYVEALSIVTNPELEQVIEDVHAHKEEFPAGEEAFHQTFDAWHALMDKGHDQHQDSMRDISKNKTPNTTFKWNVDHGLVHPEQKLLKLIDAEPIKENLVKFKQLLLDEIAYNPEWNGDIQSLHHTLDSAIDCFAKNMLENLDSDLGQLVIDNQLHLVRRFIQEDVMAKVAAEEAKNVVSCGNCDKMNETKNKQRAEKDNVNAVKTESDLQSGLLDLLKDLQVKVDIVIVAMTGAKQRIDTEVGEAEKRFNAEMMTHNEFHDKRLEGWAADLCTLKHNFDAKSTDCHGRTTLFQAEEQAYWKCVKEDVDTRSAYVKELEALLEKEKQRQEVFRQKTQRFLALRRVQQYEDKLREDMNTEHEQRTKLYNRCQELDTAAKTCLGKIEEEQQNFLLMLLVRRGARQETLTSNRSNIQNQYADYYEQFFALAMVKANQLEKQLQRNIDQTANSQDDLEAAVEEGDLKEEKRLQALIEDMKQQREKLEAKLQAQMLLLENEETVALPVLVEIGRDSTKDQVLALLDSNDQRTMKKMAERLERTKATLAELEIKNQVLKAFSQKDTLVGGYKKRGTMKTQDVKDLAAAEAAGKIQRWYRVHLKSKGLVAKKKAVGIVGDSEEL